MLLPARRLCTAILLVITPCAGAGIALFYAKVPAEHAEAGSHAVRFLEPGWTLRVVRQMPEQVYALAASESRDRKGTEIYVGTGPLGGIYRFSPAFPQSLATIALGLGEWLQYGTCCVSDLAVRDLDHDGIPELLATTSQITPSSRPRLYVWSLDRYPTLRGVASPALRSSWSHGLGFASSGKNTPDRVFSTYCGFGEVVEFQLARGKTAAEFSYETLTWKQARQLPASGEGLQTADVDNDGQPDVCLATGFALGKAAVHVYSAGAAAGSSWHLKHVIAEGGRFGNVKFLIGDTRGDGLQDLVTWWCTGIGGGACEIIRYRLGPEGVRQRLVLGRGTAASLWPIDGQMALADLSRAGSPEIWFATGAGDLWRCDPKRSPALAHVCHVEGGLGPIISRDSNAGERPVLFIGCDRDVLGLSPSG